VLFDAGHDFASGVQWVNPREIVVTKQAETIEAKEEPLISGLR
jgi:hypothetical protein